MTSKRLNCIDWMKAVGMYIIIVGHTFPEGLVPFVYSFSVPLFFFISGFLNNEEKTGKEFFFQCARTLVIPYLLICLCNMAIDFLCNGCSWDLKTICCKMLYILGGMHHLFGIIGCGTMWFVYTLIVIKMLWLWCQGSKTKPVFLLICCLIGTLLFNYTVKRQFGWAVGDVMIAFPFFYLGILAKRNRHVLIYVTFGGGKSCILLIIGTIILYIFSQLNDAAYMYIGRYGNNLLLFLLNGVLGIYLMYTLANLLNGIKIKAVTILSIGTILILGFHVLLLELLAFLPQPETVVCMNLLKAVFSFAVLLVFIPIIHIVKKNFPILLGKR